MITSIMYHYVRPVENSELRYLALDDFVNQLDWLSKNVGEFISQEDWESAKNGANRDGVLLTFDDGLKDHFNYVLPVLQEKKMFAIFFVNTQPLLTPVMLPVHLTHLLLSIDKSKEILESFKTLLSKEIWEKATLGVASQAYIHQRDSENNKTVKKLVNYLFDEFNAQNILQQICEIFVGKSLEKISQDWYLSVDEVLGLHNAGMKIGSHTVSHRLLAKLDKDEMYSELKRSKLHLEKITNSEIDEFCYPYGGTRSYTNLTQDYLKILNYSVAHDVNHREITSADFIDRYTLPRFDCNFFPFGVAHSLKNTR